MIPYEKIVDIAIPFLPASHLKAFQEVRRRADVNEPAEVWRALANDRRVRFDGTTDRWVLNLKGD